MVKINLKYKNDKYQSIQMSGHANAGDYGHDLVCAALTGIVSGAMNAMDTYHKEDIEIKVLDNKIIIEVNTFENEELQIMFKMLKVQLETIAVQYPANAELKEVR
ncbi:ribosomal-processing cysteine protease Prp [[Acholeplasma] multilocale]|uniref:ribosomal-processing cysteine protease Prp n=1 Tax=[Acholeplasma] multilocale TaxID=264638 RepID=UPI0004048B73|nr:ribosomal-processing cysteine protease Prp [[Acholeplasma] multilocale]